MEKITCKNRGLSILHVTMNILGLFVSVSAQPGFLNIDCGGRRNSIDSETNMSWIVDANYVDVAHTANVSMPNTPFYMQSLRFFPKPLNKSCYRLPVSPNVNYLLRLWFPFGNYKESQKLPSFNASFETEGLLTQKVQSINYAQTIQWTSEKILTSPNGILYVCLIRTVEDSDPFVSAIQLRSLVSGMYSFQVRPGIMLSCLARHDLGNNSPGRIRLPDGKDAAVKLLSSSKQGLAEFLNEINLLSRVHHKNLVSLIGYCNESEELMLVYEHMCGGSLNDHLYGSLSNTCTLDWKARLAVALDAAQGLEYLHVNCTPKIVHRDVKSSNILLDSNLRAKMADFGLSKIIGDEVISSHITTTVKGTVGYLDPEYFHTNKLTEKRDVYSFGVVLLEMICGRKAIDPELCEEELSLLKCVMLHVEVNDDAGDPLTGIIDQRLIMSDIDMKSLYHIFDLSLKCILTEGSKRPTITDIVTQIKEAIDIIKSEYSTEAINEPRSSIEYSYSLLDIGR
ncbi:hypothetical protein SUGI_0019700 [Cryptomeria japonica]|uniref:leucine-rich repeat receptor-like serine/threonine-protein kinase At2g14510 n=1 Tax=Cryptomeria japonica TaxID=3369 RepID=UPI002408D3CB|nr:leucine-rich repeat receptor-like serine/threonine-protein kinase At2g14510 [Cryptomeria japonica]GLJ05532.1 hypothetical protein SUGI_0019700 [Cryptomeria japonica]